MKLPRSLSGVELMKALHRVGYNVSRQTGSHIRLTYKGSPSHHLTIPNHDSIRIGTLSSIISDVAAHLKIPKEELIKRLF